MSAVRIFDSTLRDGSHAIGHQFSAEQIKSYCTAIDGAGVYTVIVGHGNGLGASSHQVGFAALADKEMIALARQSLKKTKLGVFIIPGFGTIADDLAPAIGGGIDVVCVASHCTEADTSKQYIEYAKAQNKEVYGVLMMYHMTTKERLLEEAQKMESYGAEGIIIMDSAGSSTPGMVSETIKHLVGGLKISVGFHAHNNLSLAVSNTLLALECGATIVDGTVRGFGAGAGNCQLEVLVALLEKIGFGTGVNLYKLMDASDQVVAGFLKKPIVIDTANLMGGLTGVFSVFAVPIRRAAEQYWLDPRDIYLELGKRKVVGGQEDIVIEVATLLAAERNKKV